MGLEAPGARALARRRAQLARSRDLDQVRLRPARRNAVSCTRGRTHSRPRGLLGGAPDAYLARFGPLFDLSGRFDFEDDETPELDEGGDPLDLSTLDMPSYEQIRAGEAVYHELRFATFTGDDTRVVYATFGAAPRTGGHEVFLVAVAPFQPLASVLSERAVTGVRLAPGLVVPLRVQNTPFSAVLFAPLDAGSFVVERGDDRDRCALRAIPLTPAEQKLASDSVEQLVRALRLHGALDAVDPMRDCVLAPARTQQFWAFLRPWLDETTRQRVERATAHLDDMVSRDAPRVILEQAEQAHVVARATRRYVEARNVDPDSPAERLAKGPLDHQARLERIWNEATEGVPLPQDARARKAVAEIVGLALATHPAAQRLAARLDGTERAPPFDARDLVAKAARWICRFHAEAVLGVLLSAGRSGAALAEEKSSTADGGASPSETWKTILWSMYLKLWNPPSLEEAQQDPVFRAVIDGIGVGAAAFGREEMDPPEPTEERLAGDARLVVLMMLLVLHDAEPDAPPAAPQGPPWRH